MNKRIQELAIEAGYSKDFVEIGLPGNQLKFAELIVRESAKIVNYYYSRNEPVTSQQILQHFGIEEQR